eukprot:195388_1
MKLQLIYLMPRERVSFLTNDSCLPYLISMPINVSNWSRTFPSCTFWNASLQTWDDKGCTIYQMDADSVTCACIHLTTFKVSAEDFDPKAELLSASDFGALTAPNIAKYPTTWLTMILIWIVLLLACICTPNNHVDTPIIAFEEIIYKRFRDEHLVTHEEWYQIQRIDAHSSNYCLLSIHLFETYLKNEHTILSVFERSDGTNLSTRQRIGLLLLYLSLIMMADAMFYGGGQRRKPMGDLTASALISLLATLPVYMIRILFEWSKPRVVKMAKKTKANVVVPKELKNAIAALKKSRRPDMKLVRECLNYSGDKTALAEEIRVILFSYNYPLPEWCKKVAWSLVILLPLFCMIISVIYGLQFDIKSQQMDAIQNEIESLGQMNAQSFCNMSHVLDAKQQVFAQQLLDEEGEEEYHVDDFGDIYDSTKWLLNILISFLTSVFVWQPLAIYGVTWIKLLALHRRLRMEASVYNVVMLLCSACSKKKKNEKNVMPIMLRAR